MKITSLLAALALSVIAFAAPASATGGDGDQPSADNKRVQFCHYAGSNENGGSGTYTRPGGENGISVSAFYNAGHIDHVNDIWPAFSYTTVGGDVVNVPAQGDQSLLAFEDCTAPKVDEEVTKPDVVFADPCGTEDDVFSVAPGRGYTVGATQTDGVIQVIPVTLNEGFIWTDKTKDALRFERPVFTDVDCDIPNTGAPQYATGAGAGAIAGIAVLGTLMLLRRRATI